MAHLTDDEDEVVPQNDEVDDDEQIFVSDEIPYAIEELWLDEVEVEILDG